MTTLFLLFCAIIAVLGGVPIPKEGSGWSAAEKESEDLSEDELGDDVSVGLLHHRISTNEKDSFDYDSSLSSIYSSIVQASISEYDGYANDRIPENHVVTTSATQTSSSESEVDTVKNDVDGHTLDHGPKDGVLNKTKSDKGDSGIAKTSNERERKDSEGTTLKISKVGCGLVIFFGTLVIVLFVIILSGTLTKMIKKLRS